MIKVDDEKQTKEEKIASLAEYLGLRKRSVKEGFFEEQIKEMICEKICKVMGIKRKCNFDNKFFRFFCMIVGETLSGKFSLHIEFAPIELRCVRYDGVNLVRQVEEYFKKYDVDEAFLDSFMLIDGHKYIFDTLLSFKPVVGLD